MFVYSVLNFTYEAHVFVLDHEGSCCAAYLLYRESRVSLVDDVMHTSAVQIVLCVLYGCTHLLYR